MSLLGCCCAAPAARQCYAPATCSGRFGLGRNDLLMDVNDEDVIWNLARGEAAMPKCMMLRCGSLPPAVCCRLRLARGMMTDA